MRFESFASFSQFLIRWKKILIYSSLMKLGRWSCTVHLSSLLFWRFWNPISHFWPQSQFPNLDVIFQEVHFPHSFSLWCFYYLLCQLSHIFSKFDFFLHRFLITIQIFLKSKFWVEFFGWCVFVIFACSMELELWLNKCGVGVGILPSCFLSRICIWLGYLIFCSCTVKESSGCNDFHTEPE